MCFEKQGINLPLWMATSNGGPRKVSHFMATDMSMIVGYKAPSSPTHLTAVFSCCLPYEIADLQSSPADHFRKYKRSSNPNVNLASEMKVAGLRSRSSSPRETSRKSHRRRRHSPRSSQRKARQSPLTHSLPSHEHSRIHLQTENRA